MTYGSLKNKLLELDIELNGLRRQYKIDVDRDYFNIENSTPIYMTLDIDTTFYCESWSELTEKIVLFLFKNFVKDEIELKRIKCSWNNKYPFSKNKQFDTSIKITDNLYLNYNFSSLHAYWFICDLLSYFRFDLKYSKICLTRTQKAEDRNVTKLVHEALRDEFDYYLYNLGMSDKKRSIILKNMDYINKMLNYVTTDYFDFYLFDTTYLVNYYRTKVIRSCYKFKSLGENGTNTIKMCLDYYQAFYKNLLKTVRKG